MQAKTLYSVTVVEILFVKFSYFCYDFILSYLSAERDGTTNNYQWMEKVGKSNLLSTTIKGETNQNNNIMVIIIATYFHIMKCSSVL